MNKSDTFLAFCVVSLWLIIYAIIANYEHKDEVTKNCLLLGKNCEEFKNITK